MLKIFRTTRKYKSYILLYFHKSIKRASLFWLYVSFLFFFFFSHFFFESSFHFLVSLLLFFGFSSCCCCWWIEHYHHHHHHKQPKQTNNPKTTNMPIFFCLWFWLADYKEEKNLFDKKELFIYSYLANTYIQKKNQFLILSFFWKEKKKELERKNRIEKQNLYKKKIIRFVNMDLKVFRLFFVRSFD